ncbi:hypothetical protein [Trichoplusia ni ascovirus 2c]|uniref:hypothetical protein n=1 Tax=Trichoplusia ni ascovirus 2c TaxID=328615 RepID=UPI0000E441F3|nr:hypothetical protein TNAV2c_gp027 [Trichoplusia ni ascovirus 2c]ABF70544.1 hypothetical protein [Trichoplusia ni ascovirus 2c]
MLLSNVQFGKKTLSVPKIEHNGVDWFLANPFGESLKYVNLPNAIAKHVTKKNQRFLYQLMHPPPREEEDDSSPFTIKYNSRFINKAGIWELIQNSPMKEAQEFRDWQNSDVMPKLCDVGEYNMLRDAPRAIIDGMNTMHSATNEGRKAPWYQQEGAIGDLHEITLCIRNKDDIIAKCLQENSEQRLALAAKDELIGKCLVEIASQRNVNESYRVALEEKDRRVDALMHRVMDLSERAVEYPSKAHQQPILLLTQEGNH